MMIIKNNIKSGNWLGARIKHNDELYHIYLVSVIFANIIVDTDYDKSNVRSYLVSDD